jgi:hypothetical protein
LVLTAGQFTVKPTQREKLVTGYRHVASGAEVRRTNWAAGSWHPLPLEPVSKAPEWLAAGLGRELGGSD